MRRLHGSARIYLCEGCCGSRARDWAMIHGRTGLVPMIDRVPLCRPCHIRYDEAGMTGKTHSAETRAKISRVQTGSPRSPEMRLKISQTLTGRKKTPEHIENVAAANRGRKRSAEARQRMSDAAKRRHARERQENA